MSSKNWFKIPAGVLVILVFTFTVQGNFYKAVAHKVPVYCYSILTGLKISDNDANITATISKDGGAPAATGDTNPAELGSTGVYIFDVNAVETNANMLVLAATLADANYQIDPIVIYTDVNYAANIALILEDTGTTTPAALAVIDDIVDNANANTTLILEDTGTTLPALANDINDVLLAEMLAILDELADVNDGLVEDINNIPKKPSAPDGG